MVPVASLEPLASTLTAKGAAPELGVAVKNAVGPLPTSVLTKTCLKPPNSGSCSLHATTGLPFRVLMTGVWTAPVPGAMLSGPPASDHDVPFHCLMKRSGGQPGWYSGKAT